MTEAATNEIDQARTPEQVKTATGGDIGASQTDLLATDWELAQ